MKARFQKVNWGKVSELAGLNKRDQAFEDFWGKVSKLMGAEIRRTTSDYYVEMYLRPYDRIYIHDNGGEINIEVDRLPWFGNSQQKGWEPCKYQIGYSIAYSHTNGIAPPEAMAYRIQKALEGASERELYEGAGKSW